MPIAIVCPKCRTKLRVADKTAGRQVACPRCGWPLAIPTGIHPTEATGATPAAVRHEQPGSYPRMRLRLVYLGLCRRLRSACDAVGFGPAAAARVAFLVVVAALLFGASIALAFLLHADPFHAFVWASCVGAVPLALGLPLAAGRGDDEQQAERDRLTAALPNAKLAWEAQKERNAIGREQARDERFWRQEEARLHAEEDARLRGEEEDVRRQADTERPSPMARNVVLSAFLWAGVLTLALLPFGVYLSQYYPVFGGWEKLGVPWSPARESLIPIHLFVFGLVGIVLGAAFGGAVEYLVGGNNPIGRVGACVLIVLLLVIDVALLYYLLVRLGWLAGQR